MDRFNPPPHTHTINTKVKTIPDKVLIWHWFVKWEFIIITIFLLYIYHQYIFWSLLNSFMPVSLIVGVMYNKSSRPKFIRWWGTGFGGFWPVESVTFFSGSGFLAQPDPDDPAKMFRFLTTDIIWILSLLDSKSNASRYFLVSLVFNSFVNY